MSCKLCLKSKENILNLLDTEDVIEGPARILGKHFWFEEEVVSEIVTAICSDCWQQTIDFHGFYIRVEVAQKSLQVKDEYECDMTDQTSLGGDDTAPIPEAMQVKRRSKRKSLKCESVVDTPEDKATLGTDDIAPIPEAIQVKRRSKRKSLKCESVVQTSLEKDNTPPDDDESVPDTPKDKEKSASECFPFSKEVSNRKLNAEYFANADKIIKENMTLTCNLCHSVENDYRSLMKHFKTVHNKTGYAVCCNKKLYKRVHIIDHINFHKDPDLFKCPESDCGKTFTDKKGLYMHTSIVHAKEKAFGCDQCHQKFAKSYLLESHVLTHLPEDEKNFECDVCKKKFSTETLMKSHRKNQHEGYMDYVCHICARTIRGRNVFKQHLAEHEGISLPEVDCTVCGAHMKNKHSLRRHMYLHTDEGKTFVCDICGKEAPSRNGLQSHKKHMHEAKKVHSCTICGKSFKVLTNLKEHMMTHTGGALYTCPHCPKEFISNANMHHHRKKMHRTEWENQRNARRNGKTFASVNAKLDEDKESDDG